MMEYMPGGDLMTLLIKKEILPEDMAKFYLAQVREILGRSGWERRALGLGIWSLWLSHVQLF